MRIIKKTDAFAKVNLTLDVVGVKENGYHYLESIMQTVSLKDSVIAEYVSESPFDIAFDVFPDSFVDCERKENLCYKAAERFCEVFGIDNGRIIISLKKQIPVMAGLGGGSSDCAAVIRLLSSIFKIDVLRDERVVSVAASLGSDVPFFLKGGLRKISGVGEKTSPLKSKINGYFVMIKPKEGLSAKEVYDKFDEMPFVSTNFTREAEKSGLSFSSFGNGLETAGFILCPKCGKIKEDLLLAGADTSFLCGSGTSVCGIFKTYEAAEKAFFKFDKNNYFTSLCRPVYETEAELVSDIF